MFILVTYDISNTKRRVKIENLLSSYGFSVNYSVFECFISKLQYNRLIKTLKKLSKKQDNIRVYILNKESIKKSFILNQQIKPFEFEDGYI